MINLNLTEAQATWLSGILLSLARHSLSGSGYAHATAIVAKVEGAKTYDGSRAGIMKNRVRRVGDLVEGGPSEQD